MDVCEREETEDMASKSKKYKTSYSDSLEVGTYVIISISHLLLFYSPRLERMGLVVQPNLFWLGASPDGMIINSLYVDPALIEIKCLYSKRHMSPTELLNDNKFYVYEKDGVTFLKRNHEYGYFTQVQLAMGLSQIMKCYFTVYTFKGMIITVVDFDEKFFYRFGKKIK